MATIKISSKVEAQVWEELRQLAKESHQNVSGLLTEAISDYLPAATSNIWHPGSGR